MSGQDFATGPVARCPGPLPERQADRHHGTTQWPAVRAATVPRALCDRATNRQSQAGRIGPGCGTRRRGRIARRPRTAVGREAAAVVGDLQCGHHPSAAVRTSTDVAPAWRCCAASCRGAGRAGPRPPARPPLAGTRMPSPSADWRRSASPAATRTAPPARRGGPGNRRARGQEEESSARRDSARPPSVPTGAIVPFDGVVAGQLGQLDSPRRTAMGGAARGSRRPRRRAPSERHLEPVEHALPESRRAGRSRRSGTAAPARGRSRTKRSPRLPVSTSTGRNAARVTSHPLSPRRPRSSGAARGSTRSSP